MRVLEKANYEYEKVQKIIKAEVEELESQIHRIEEMSEEQFLREISKSLFGVANKGYYTNQKMKTVEELKLIPQQIEYFLDLCVKDKQILEWIIKNHYKGYVKRMREAIEKLAESRFNAKLLSFLG